MVQVDEPDMRVRGRRLLCKQIPEFVPQERFLASFYPFQQATVVNRQEMDNILNRSTVVERLEEFVEQLVGRIALPRCRTVEIHSNRQSIIQLSFQNACCGGLPFKPQSLREVLKQCGLAVTRIAAKDDEADAPFHDIAVERSLQIGFDVRRGGKFGIQTARLAIPPTRPGIRLQQRLQPFHLVLLSLRRLRLRHRAHPERFFAIGDAA